MNHEEVSIDFAQVEIETVLVLVDDYSHFPVVEPISTASARAVFPKLDQTFATIVTPTFVSSHNLQPFNGENLRKFAKTFGIHHRKDTPL